MTSPEQGAQQECSSTLVLPSGNEKLGRRASGTIQSNFKKSVERLEPQVSKELFEGDPRRVVNLQV